MTQAAPTEQNESCPTESKFGIRNGATGMSLGFLEIFDTESGQGVAAVYSRAGNPYQIARKLVTSSDIADQNAALRNQIEDLIRERDQAQVERDSACGLVHLYQEELGVWSCCGTALRGKDETCPKCERENAIHSNLTKDS